MSWLSTALKQASAASVLIPLFAAGLGATIGAVSAGRRERKREITAELNGIAATHLLCFSIANRFMGLKRQHVRPLKERFDDEMRKLEQFEKARSQSPGVPRIFELHTDLQTITPLKVPIDVLQ